MTSIVAAAATFLVALYAFCWTLLHLTQDAKEPPLIESSIPFLSPIIGMIKHKTRFHSYLRDKYHLPIYTLRLPGARMYVVNSPAIVPSVQRLYRTLSFAAIEAQTATYIMSVTKSADDVIHEGLMDDESYTGSFARAIHPATAPGESLDAMNRASVRAISLSLDHLQASGCKVDTLFGWMRYEILMATTEAVYGPHNPFRDPEIRQAWW